MGVGDSLQQKAGPSTGLRAGPISAVLADIDGTMVTKDKVLTERAIQAVNRLRERGIVFTICSSRSPRGLRMLVEPLGLTMPMAAFNGGVMVLPDLSVLDERAIPDYVVPAIVDLILAQGLDVWIHTATDWYVRDRQARRVVREASTSQCEPTVVTTFDGVLSGVVKIVGVSDDAASVAACEAELQSSFGTQVSAARSQAYYLDVTHPTANKGAVIERLARFLKIPMEAIAAIGDQPTDVLMFKRSGMSIAVGNAPEEVRRQATHVSTSNEDEGFANAVDQFILPRAEPARTDMRKATGQLHRLGQSLWLDNITRDLLTSGTLKRYIDDLSVTGLTSNPTIFEQAIKNSSAYDTAISAKLAQGKSGEKLFFELALDDLRRAADLFRPIYDRTNGIDGWVSLEVSPLLAQDTAGTIAAARTLFAERAGRPNLMIKIPGTTEGLPAIEEAIYDGIPINVTLLFSREHYFAAAEAFLRGIERRIDAGLKPDVASVASVFVSRWDAAVAGTSPEALRGQLAIAMAKRTYKAYRSLLSSPRWQRVYNAGARPQRLLWASTGTKDPNASDDMYIKALAAPFTVNTIPEKTLIALADHGELTGLLHANGGDCEEVLARFAGAGVNVQALAARLQAEGAASFVKSWHSLMAVIASKSASLTTAT
jgi:transaldolase